MISTYGMTVAALKKEPYSGSHQGMRYYAKKSEDGLDVCVYPEPWCFEQTPEEEKVKKTFPLNQEGLDDAIAWINDCFEKDRNKWHNIENNKMQILLGRK